MDRTEAIKTLGRAGKRDETVALIRDLAGKAQSRFDGVRSDGTRTDNWRRWRMANVATGYLNELDAELEKRAKAVGRLDKTDAESVFGVLGINGDEASKTISRRDAGDRVAGITIPEELRTLLAKATRQNDEILARAVAERAMEIGDNHTLEQFMEDRPTKQAAVQRLWDAERSGVDMVMMTAHLSALLPEEVKGFEDVRYVASQPEPGAPEQTEVERRHETFLSPLYTGSPGW